VGAGFPRDISGTRLRGDHAPIKEMERDDDSKKSHRALAARGYSAAAGDRLFESPMRRSQPSAIGVVAAPGAAGLYR